MNTAEKSKVWWTYDYAPTRKVVVASLVIAWFFAILFLYPGVVKILATRPWWEDLIVALATVAVPILAFLELRHSAEANRLRGEANDERRKANRLSEENAQLAGALDAERNKHLAQIATNIARPPQEPAASLPDVILECQWPSLLHEPHTNIPGAHTVRKRPWLLRYRSAGAVYNVRVHRIPLGEYEAVFISTVASLTDAATVYPTICLKSTGMVVTTHDLESLIQHPPSDCDVRQYATKTEGDEGEEIQFESTILEVEIPVTISYEDKNGNQFRIRYLLHYDLSMEKGEMIRNGKIEKIALEG